MGEVSFSSWKEAIIEREAIIIFYDISTPSRGSIYQSIAVRVRDIHAEVLSSLGPGTAVVRGYTFIKLFSEVKWNEEKLTMTTLFVSSQEEADAWNRYFAELLAERERKMREKWGPKKIQPPPTLQKSD